MKKFVLTALAFMLTAIGFVFFNTASANAALVGDADGDGYITGFDASLILQYEVGLINENKLDITAADVDADHYVTGFDASLILQYEVGLITTFPAGTTTSGGTGTLSASAPEGNVSAGDPVTLTFTVEQNPGIAGLQFDINFDSSTLTSPAISAVVLGANTNGGAKLSSSGNSIRVIWYGYDDSSLKYNITETGALLSVTFTAASDITFDPTSMISISGLKAVDFYEKNVEFTVTGAAVA